MLSNDTLALQIRLVLLPPSRIALEESQADLRSFVAGHLVLEAATLLLEGTDALVDPFVTECFFLLQGTSTVLRE